MSSTEPPARVPPRQNQPTKAERDELSSKGKVEKVREVDADETRKQKFRKVYEDKPDAKEPEPRPSLFDLQSQNGTPAKKTPSVGNADSAVVASPAYSQTPRVSDNAAPPRKIAQSKDLPQSDDFWEDVDAPPDQPLQKKKFQESHPLTKEEKDKLALQKKEAQKKEKKEIAAAPHETAHKKETSPLQGKKKRLEKEDEEESATAAPLHSAPSHAGKKSKESKEEFSSTPAEIQKRSEREEHTREKSKEKSHKPFNVEGIALPQIPATVQPAATAALQTAAPYLHPSTVPLFYQMVGTVLVMVSKGVSSTEIVLNSPAFANSKFFGATITLEKYATAPHSFNIRLTGSEQAVASFKENAASLMSAFQHGKFDFKINRLDAEYTLEKPVFRRRQKGEGKDTGGGDLGERRR